MARLRVVDLPDNDLEEMKARVDLRRVVVPDALVRADKPLRVLCLWHQETNGSLYLWPDHLHCFGCGVHMDLLDYVAWREGLDVARDMARVVDIITGQYGDVPPPPLPRKRRGALSTSVAEYYHGRLGGKREWFRKRGLADWVIDRQLLGYDGRAFTIPVWSADWQLLTLRFRRDDSVRGADRLPKYWGMDGRNETLLYNAWALDRVAREWDFAVVCEGELDALRLSQEGLPAVSCTNGAGGMTRAIAEQIMAWDVDRYIVAYDRDEAGLVNAQRVAWLFGSRGRVASWPREWGKDVTEVLLNRDVCDLLDMLEAASESGYAE